VGKWGESTPRSEGTGSRTQTRLNLPNELFPVMLGHVWHVWPCDARVASRTRTRRVDSKDRLDCVTIAHALKSNRDASLNSIGWVVLLWLQMMNAAPSCFCATIQFPGVCPAEFWPKWFNIWQGYGSLSKYSTYVKLGRIASEAACVEDLGGCPEGVAAAVLTFHGSVEGLGRVEH
jgi:hypothetical protein